MGKQFLKLSPILQIFARWTENPSWQDLVFATRIVSFISGKETNQLYRLLNYELSYTKADYNT